jgi:DNA-binding response OmpR family regulator/predicted  nucleic acid-binding Zn-ribbon protein
MSKNILIVESESALSRSVRNPLEDRGFAVQETADGRGSLDLIRRQKPDLVLMEVELSAGQNGYILCGKLKKDDELKHIPIVMVGNADGFAQHKKLKTRADEYVAKPLNAEGLVQTVGTLIGFPEPMETSEVVEDGLSLSELVEEDPPSNVLSAEEISLEPDESRTLTGDDELDLLEAAFDEVTGRNGSPPSSVGVDVEAEIAEVDLQSPNGGGDRDDFPGLSADGGGSSYGSGFGGDNRSRFQFAPPAERPALPAGTKPAGASHSDGSEHRVLRARLLELERALDEANERAETAEARARDAEEQLASRTSELEAARASGGRSDKEFFALREAGNKKDKEILRLKSEINAKENEIVEVRDSVLQLEQRIAEASAELSRRDTQIKTLSHKADQLAQERKRLEQQLASARDEARSAAVNLDTVQSDLDETREQLASARAELEEARSVLERIRPVEEEAASLRGRISELEELVQKHEERVSRFYAKLKDDEQIREKTRKALGIALQLLDEQQQAHIDIDLDDEAAKS